MRCGSPAPLLAGPVVVPVCVRMPEVAAAPDCTWMLNSPALKVRSTPSAATIAAEPLTLIVPPCVMRGATIAT